MVAAVAAAAAAAAAWRWRGVVAEAARAWQQCGSSTAASAALSAARQRDGGDAVVTWRNQFLLVTQPT